MTKITPYHLARSAIVYIRQSTADQVLNNHESRRLNTALRNARGSWAGRTSWSSAMISGALAPASPGLVSNAF